MTDLDDEVVESQPLPRAFSSFKLGGNCSSHDFDALVEAGVVATCRVWTDDHVGCQYLKLSHEIFIHHE